MQYGRQNFKKIIHYNIELLILLSNAKFSLYLKLISA